MEPRRVSSKLVVLLFVGLLTAIIFLDITYTSGIYHKFNIFLIKKSYKYIIKIIQIDTGQKVSSDRAAALNTSPNSKSRISTN